MGKPRKPKKEKSPKKAAINAPPPGARVQALGLRRCTTCGTQTNAELCPVDGERMERMPAAEVSDAG